MDGLEATRQIKRDLPDAQVVALTVHDNEVYLFRMLSAGASGYVLKDAPLADLLGAVRTAHQGRVFLPPTMAGKLVTEYLRWVRRGRAEESYEPLSEREREVLKLLADGCTHKEIALRLSISIRTVETYQARIMEKLGLQRRAELIKYALRWGLIAS